MKHHPKPKRDAAALSTRNPDLAVPAIPKMNQQRQLTPGTLRRYMPERQSLLGSARPQAIWHPCQGGPDEQEAQKLEPQRVS
jgi:hypothetical protein